MCEAHRQLQGVEDQTRVASVPVPISLGLQESLLPDGTCIQWQEFGMQTS